MELTIDWKTALLLMRVRDLRTVFSVYTRDSVVVGHINPS